jgi:DNA polymerase bacteriophage-type
MLYLDTETYNTVDISAGTYAYAETAEVMLIPYAIGDGPGIVWDRTASPVMPADLAQALASDTPIVAHNAQFDREVLHTNGIATELTRWRCTMAQALAHSLPGSLQDLGEALGLSDGAKKDKGGKALIQLFCKPRPKNQKLSRATRHTHPAEWAQFIEYARQDVDALRAVHKALPDWNYKGRELALWHLDQTINQRGVAVDLELSRAAVEAVQKEQAQLAEESRTLTDGAVMSTTQTATLRKYLAGIGVDLSDLQASTIAAALADSSTPEVAKALLINRQSASATSVAKYGKLIDAASADGRLRGTLQFCGASRTGRWAGRVFQPQNLPRPSLKQWQIEIGIAALKLGVADVVMPVTELCSSALRGVLIAPPGKRLVVSDLSNIEGRVLAWLAREEWKVQAFRDFDAGTAPDIYAMAYAKSFGVSPEKVMENKENGDGMMRQIGKVQELALGFQGGPGAFVSMASIYGVTLPEEQVKGIVRAWRKAHPAIVSLWGEIERVVREAINAPREVFDVCGLKVSGQGKWLRVRLHSGRYLCYPHPHITDEGKIAYMGQNAYTRKWEALETYGGKLVENITQATARDVMAAVMPSIEKSGFKIVLTVHDEVITEAEDMEEFSSERLSALLASGAPWAQGLPLAAGGFVGYRYRKD